MQLIGGRQVPSQLKLAQSLGMEQEQPSLNGGIEQFIEGWQKPPTQLTLAHSLGLMQAHPSP